MPSSSPSPSRRRVLRSVAGATAVAAGGATAGCLDAFRSSLPRSDLAWPGFMGDPGRTGWRETANALDGTPASVDAYPFESTIDAPYLPFPAVSDGAAYVARAVESDEYAENSIVPPSSGNVLEVLTVDLDGSHVGWRTRVDVGSGYGVDPPLAVAVTDDAVVAGCLEEIAVLDRDTGDVRWTRDRVAPMPTVRDDLVLTFGVRDASEPVLTSHDLDTGAVEWTADRGVLPGHRTDVRPPIASVDADRVYAASRSKVAAIERGTGERAWLHDLDGYGGVVRQFAPAVRGDRVYVVQSRPDAGDQFLEDLRSRVVALDAETGAVVWSQRIGDGVERFATTNPVVGPELVVVAESDPPTRGDAAADVSSTLWAFDRDTGDERWRTRAPGRLSGRTLADGSTVYVTGDGDGDAATEERALYAFDAASGDLAWRVGTDGPELAALGADAVFSTSSDATLRRLH